jgi:hypothetical protein
VSVGAEGENSRYVVVLLSDSGMQIVGRWGGVEDRGAARARKVQPRDSIRTWNHALHC